jgi:hypothetical protein
MKGPYYDTRPSPALTQLSTSTPPCHTILTDNLCFSLQRTMFGSNYLVPFRTWMQQQKCNVPNRERDFIACLNLSDVFEAPWRSHNKHITCFIKWPTKSYSIWTMGSWVGFKEPQESMYLKTTHFSVLCTIYYVPELRTHPFPVSLPLPTYQFCQVSWLI